jgi:hypothetical protein
MNNKYKKIIYDFDMLSYQFYVKAGYFPIKNNKKGVK